VVLVLGMLPLLLLLLLLHAAAARASRAAAACVRAFLCVWGWGGF
jgi:hypothetical protein